VATLIFVPAVFAWLHGRDRKRVTTETTTNAAHATA
jgi:hypothetical protein